MSKLIPERITVSSECKYFQKGEHGTSDGSMLSTTFTVPEGMTEMELKIAQFEEKELLDHRVLVMEFAKGMLPAEMFKQRKAMLKSQYDKILKRENGPGATQPATLEPPKA